MMLCAFSLARKFVVELAAFAAFGYWGRERRPAATRRLATAPRMGFEVAIVGVATIALLVAGAPATAAVLAVLVANEHRAAA